MFRILWKKCVSRYILAFKKCIQIRFMCHKLITFKVHEDYMFSTFFIQCIHEELDVFVFCILPSFFVDDNFDTCSKTAIVFPSDKNSLLRSLILLSKILGSSCCTNSYFFLQLYWWANISWWCFPSVFRMYIFLSVCYFLSCKWIVIYFYLYYRMVPLCSIFMNISADNHPLYRCWLYNDCSLSWF